MRVSLSRPHQAGFSLVELLVVVAILSLLLGLAWRGGSETLARQRLEAASRRLAQGIERARAEARRLGRPCALALGTAGWESGSGGTLLPCRTASGALLEAESPHALRVQHNLPPLLRLTANGLVLDGGTVVLALAGTTLRRCLVMALPLGVVRQGRYIGDLESAPLASACVVDEAL